MHYVCISIDPEQPKSQSRKIKIDHERSCMSIGKHNRATSLSSNLKQLDSLNCFCSRWNNFVLWELHSPPGTTTKKISWSNCLLSETV